MSYWQVCVEERDRARASTGCGRRCLPSALVLLAVLPVASRATAGEAPTGPVAGCVTAECHGEVLAGRVLHGPVSTRKCDACHTLSDPARHRFSMIFPEERLCSSCHVQTYRTFVHDPVASGECTGCHSPHGSDHRYLLLDDAAGGLCDRCHDVDDYESKEHVHGPVAAGACIVCHEVHSAWNPKLLTEPEEELCLSCHEDVVAGLKLARHAHQPVVEGRCLACHDPHASDHRAQLREPPPRLCFSCHEHDMIRSLVETSPNVHGAIDEGASCLGCHSGHGGPNPKLLRRPLMGLCLSCHDRPLKTTEGRMLTDMAALLRDNPNHHGPVRRADCSACHNPHASSHSNLLVRDYPEMLYAPFDLANYDLCFTCHMTEMVTEENGLGVTGFRDDYRNLHFLHVNKKEKGRTCRACHEVHASRSPFHMSETVPFGKGGWELAINFEKLPRGGRCAPGCHGEVTYNRGERRGTAAPGAG